MTEPRITVLAKTEFRMGTAIPLTGRKWDTDADGGQALAEFAGRACYQSWSKPNPATATNAGYLRHIIEVGHLSVLEHGSVTLYIEGVSRSLTHELVRHRHFSYSQLSQRYVDESGADIIEPDVIADDPVAHAAFGDAVMEATKAYETIVRLLRRSASGQGHDPTAIRKAARQAARSVLPNATETKIVVTGNYRAWRHFIALRATEAADVEIRRLAIMVLRIMKREAPNVFQDFQVGTLADGSEIAWTENQAR